MNKPTAAMLHTLQQIGESTCTAFGYNRNSTNKRYLNVNTVHALIKRGLLEQSGETMWWNDRKASLYRLSEAGKQTLRENQSPVIKNDEAWKQVFAKGDYWPSGEVQP